MTSSISNRWPVIGAGLLAASLAAGAYVIWFRPAPALEVDPMRAAAARLDLGQLDSLYAARCDPWSGEPSTVEADGTREAVVVLRHASEDRPNDAELHRVYGEYLLLAGVNDDAARELRAATLGAVPAKVAVPLAVALSRAGKPEDVLSLPRPAFADAHQRTVLDIARARAALVLGHPDQASISLLHALDTEPRNVEAMSRLGLLQLRHGDPSFAARWLEQAAAVDANAAATLRLRGEYAFAIRDFRASADAFRALAATGAAETFDPIPPSLGLARALTYQGDLTQAGNALARTRLPGDDPNVAYYRALIAFRGGDFRHAGDLAEPLTRRLADLPALYLLLGAARLADGYPSQARRYLEHYADAVPADTRAKELLAEAAQRADQSGTAGAIPAERLFAAMGFVAASGGAAATR